MKKRYSYRAYPTPGQEQALARLFGSVRVVYNDAVALQRARREQGLPVLSASALQSQVVAGAKKTPERAWLAEVSTTPLEQSARDADKALRDFFASVSGRRKGPRLNPPRFKSKRSKQSARFTRSANFRVRETTHGVGFVRLSKIGDVRFALSRPLPSEPSSVTITKDPDGRYFVSFVVEVEPQVTVPQHDRVAALDLGLTDFAAIVYSDGTREKIPNPRHLKARERALAKAQRAYARTQKGSKNRERARVRVARQHSRVRNARHDFLHQLSSKLVRENQAVVMEKLAVAGLARSMGKGKKGHGFRRSIADAGWGKFVSLLESKSAEQMRHFTRIDPHYTSQTCSVCGVLDGPKPLSIRAWTCGSCGAFLDRDYNAAVNILVAAGLLAETLNARGGDVRLRLAEADPDKARTHRTSLRLTPQAA